MKRRDLLASLIGGVGFTAGNACLWHLAETISQGGSSADGGNLMEDDPLNVMGAGGREPELDPFGEEHREIIRGLVGDVTDDVSEPTKKEGSVVAQTEADSDKSLASIKAEPQATGREKASAGAQTRTPILEKVRNFNGDFIDDVFLDKVERPVLHSLYLRFQKAERFVGHGNFNLLGFDQLFSFGRSYTQIGDFTSQEKALIEKLFFTDAETYGFYGEKVITDLTARVPEDEIVKIPNSGHFLLKGEPLAYYESLRRDIGDSIILTSGVRGNVKQMHLFVAKCLSSNYNLSKASRSLAPPGHSYHGIGDFDVGRTGLGYANFTDRFAQTDEFKRMQDLGYAQIRYTKDNQFGVRFEPWHIKIA